MPSPCQPRRPLPQTQTLLQELNTSKLSPPLSPPPTPSTTTPPPHSQPDTAATTPTATTTATTAETESQQQEPYYLLQKQPRRHLEPSPPRPIIISPQNTALNRPHAMPSASLFITPPRSQGLYHETVQEEDTELTSATLTKSKNEAKLDFERSLVWEDSAHSRNTAKQSNLSRMMSPPRHAFERNPKSSPASHPSCLYNPSPLVDGADRSRSTSLSSLFRKPPIPVPVIRPDGGRRRNSFSIVGNHSYAHSNGLHLNGSASGMEREPFGSLVGSYEESILSGRMSMLPSKPIRFIAEIGVLGIGKCKASLRCPSHMIVNFPAYFYSMQDDDAPTPYVGTVDIEGHGHALDRQDPTRKRKKWYGYRVPPKGQLQIVVKNPNNTAVKLFLCPYDFSDMPPGTKTFVRQKSYKDPPSPTSPYTPPPLVPRDGLVSGTDPPSEHVSHKPSAVLGEIASADITENVDDAAMVKHGTLPFGETLSKPLCASSSPTSTVAPSGTPSLPTPPPSTNPLPSIPSLTIHSALTSVPSSQSSSSSACIPASSTFPTLSSVTTPPKKSSITSSSPLPHANLFQSPKNPPAAFYKTPEKKPRAASAPALRYVIHLQYICPEKKGRIYLHSAIRMVFSHRVPDGSEKLRVVNEGPSNPKYIPIAGGGSRFGKKDGALHGTPPRSSFANISEPNRQNVIHEAGDSGPVDSGLHPTGTLGDSASSLPVFPLDPSNIPTPNSRDLASVLPVSAASATSMMMDIRHLGGASELRRSLAHMTIGEANHAHEQGFVHPFANAPLSHFAPFSSMDAVTHDVDGVGEDSEGETETETETDADGNRRSRKVMNFCGGGERDRDVRGPVRRPRSRRRKGRDGVLERKEAVDGEGDGDALAGSPAARNDDAGCSEGHVRCDGPFASR